MGGWVDGVNVGALHRRWQVDETWREFKVGGAGIRLGTIGTIVIEI